MSDAEQWAEQQVREVERTLGPLPAVARATLFEQHLAYYPEYRRRQQRLALVLGAGVVLLLLARPR